MKLKRIIFLVVFISSFSTSWGQVCNILEPICTSQDGLNNTASDPSPFTITGTCVNLTGNRVAWYSILVDQVSVFTFQIEPTTVGIDYDFAVWLNADCNNMGTAIRTNWSGAPNNTGLSVGAGNTCQGGGGINQSNPINVVPGDEIIIAVDRFSATFDMFDLTFGDPDALDCSIIGSSLCEGDTETLDATDPLATNYEWTYDDGLGGGPVVIFNGPGFNMINVTDTGFYEVTVTFPSGSNNTQQFDVVFNPFPVITNPGNQTVCDSFTLPLLATIVTDAYTPEYRTASQGAGGGALIPDGSAITTTQTVWIFDTSGVPADCSDEEMFTVTVNDTPIITNPGNQFACDTFTLPAITGTNLTGNQNYYDADPTAGPATVLPIATPITVDTTVWIFDETLTTPNCQATPVTFDIDIELSPSITNPGPQAACDTFTLPAITGTNLSGGQQYFNNSQGAGGTPIVGAITSTQTVWIYDAAGTAPNICDDEISFTVTIFDTPVPTNPGNQVACDSFTLPAITGTNLTGNEAYYDADPTAGPATALPIATALTTTQTIWIFDETLTTPNCPATPVQFDLTIIQSPSITNPGPQAGCDTFTLPAITGTNLSGGEQYFNNSQVAGGTPIVGPITTTQTVWIYDAIGTAPTICDDEVNFIVTIFETPLLNTPGDQSVCDSFTLPAITGTNLTGNEAYFDADPTAGPATALPIATALTSSQTIWIFDETLTTPNCLATPVQFDLTIIQTPDITDPGDFSGCDTVTLPPITGTNLTTGAAYFDADPTLGPATALNIATPITVTTTVFIFDTTGLPEDCNDVEEVLITINNTPQITDPGTIVECNQFTLPALGAIAGLNLTANINYYDGPQGTTPPPNVITALTLTAPSTTIHIYDETQTTPNCSDEISFIVNIISSPDITNPGTLVGCDTFLLPVIIGNDLTGAEAYFDGPQGTTPPPNLIDPLIPITTTQDIWIYDSTPTSCDDEETFQVVIVPIPVHDVILDQEACDTFTFPVITELGATRPTAIYSTMPDGMGTTFTQGQTVTFFDFFPTAYPVTLFTYENTGAPGNCENPDNSFTLSIFRSPQGTVPMDFPLCDEDNDDIEDYDLSTRRLEVLGALDPLDHVVVFYETQADADAGGPSTIVNEMAHPFVADFPLTTPPSQVIFARVTEQTTGIFCFDVVPLTLVLHPDPVAADDIYLVCDDNIPDGIVLTDLSVNDTDIAGVNNTGLTVTYHNTAMDALDGVGAVDKFNYTTLPPPYPYILFTRVTNDLTGCHDEGELAITVLQAPAVVAPPPYEICDEDNDGFAVFELG
ncbi:MAG: hypothetical protein ACI828_001802, partial [Flavobacteriales bacterium]